MKKRLESEQTGRWEEVVLIKKKKNVGLESKTKERPRRSMREECSGLESNIIK